MGSSSGVAALWLVAIAAIVAGSGNGAVVHQVVRLWEVPACGKLTHLTGKARLPMTGKAKRGQSSEGDPADQPASAKRAAAKQTPAKRAGRHAVPEEASAGPEEPETRAASAPE